MPDESKPLEFLSLGGRMGSRARGHDWLNTVLGDPMHWPQALKHTVRFLFSSKHPMLIWWGPAHIQLHNDAMAAYLGDEYGTHFLGQPGQVSWGSTWKIFGPQVQAVMAQGGAVWQENARIPLARDASVKEVYWSYSFSPITAYESSTVVDGVLLICSDTTEAVRMAQHISAQRQQLAQMFEQAPSFMALLRGPEHRFEMSNQSLQRLLGHREVIGLTVADALPEAVEQGFHDVLDEVYRTGKTYTGKDRELVLRQPLQAKPDRRILDFVYQPIRDTAGSVSAIFVEGFDVTDRVAAGEALRLSEQRLRLLNAELERQVISRAAGRGLTWQVTPDLLGILNMNAVFEQTNPAWTHTLGWTADELRGTTFFALVHKDDLAATHKAFQDLSKGKPALRFENRYRTREKKYRWLSWVAVPDKDTQLFYCSARDITEEKAAREELGLRTANYDRVWRNARNVLIILGHGGTVQAVNPAWSVVLGRNPREAIGKPLIEFVWAEDISHVKGELARASQQSLTDFECRLIHSDGSVRWLSWNTYPEEDCIYGYGRDITGQKQAQAQLAQAQEALRQSQKMEAVGQLTGGIAHDFNNMLAGVMGNLELLRLRLTSGPTAGLSRYVDEAMAASRRAASLTHRLLAFARRQTLDPQPVEINGLVTAMEELLRQTLGHGVRLELELDDSLWTALCDPPQLESALLNLFINSRDAMPADGTLTITTENVSAADARIAMPNAQSQDYISVSVEDTGVGMDEEVLRRAMDPFFTTKPIGQGTGLGLSMVYGFVTQSQGHVQIQSRPGRGTNVRLYLPRYLGAPTQQVPELPATAVRENDSAIVLLVEDEHVVRQVSTEMLEELGYVVHSAGDALEGLTLFRTLGKVDLLVTDVGLPNGMNGRQLADELRALRPGLKVLFITGFAAHSAFRSDVLEPGMQVLTKPFALESFANKVHEMVHS